MRTRVHTYISVALALGLGLTLALLTLLDGGTLNPVHAQGNASWPDAPIENWDKPNHVWLRPLAPPTAAFTASPTSGVCPLVVTFTNQSTGNYTTSLWDFGDTVTSTQQHPTHTYTVAGVYSVFLMVDGPEGSSTLMRTNVITVNANAPPSFVSTPVTTATEDEVYTYTIIAIDVDVGDALDITATVKPAWLALTDHGDSTATLSGVPTNTHVGDHAVSLQVEDTFGLTDTQSFTITVNPVNDPPVAEDDYASIAEDTAIVLDVLANDSDPDGDPLSVDGVTQPANGTAVVNLDDTVTYTPDANFNGTSTFTYTVDDGNSGTDTAAVWIDVVPANDPPLFTSTPVTVATEDVTYTHNITASDIDVGDALTITALTPLPGWLTLTDHSDGTATLSGVPTNTHVGDHAVSLQVEDTFGLTDTQSFTITVNPVNDPPVAEDDYASIAEDTAIVLDVLANDSDPDGDPLSVDGVTQPANGTAVVNLDDTVTYTPDANFNGTSTFTYTVDDGNSGTDTAAVMIFVAPVNDDPVAGDDSATTDEDTAVVVDVLADDIDVDNDTLSVDGVTQPMNGTVGVNLDYTITYTPDADFNGTNTFAYIVDDGNSGTNTATVTITVNSVNDLPLFTSTPVMKATTDQVYTYNIIATDVDVGDILTITASTSLPNWLTLTDYGDGIATLSGVPSNTDLGDHAVGLQVEDAAGLIDVQSFTITVKLPNNSPVAKDDAAKTDESTAVVVDVLANDSDVDGDILIVDSVTQPANGTVVNNATDVTYTPNMHFSGEDSFMYTVSDGNGGEDTAIVIVNVFGTPSPSFVLVWEIECVDCSTTESVGKDTSLALDSNGYPRISYYDDTNGDLEYAWYDGTNWQLRTVDSVGDVGSYNSLALDMDDHPHISYFDRTEGCLKYRGDPRRSICFSGVVVGSHTSLALDADGNSHISYAGYGLDYLNISDELKRAVVDNNLSALDGTSIAIDGSRYPHISYCDGDDLRYAYRDAFGWHSETVDSRGDIGGDSSLALDGNGHPHISYHDDTNDDLKLAYHDGNGWYTQTVDSEGQVGSHTSLALDADGYPHISYYDDTNDDLKYAYLNDNGWHIQTVDSEGRVGSHTSLALDADGYPHISYYDDTNDDLKYAYARKSYLVYLPFVSRNP